jgi:hypothetical protein
MLSCHDCIVVITNPSTDDMPYINEMLKGRIIYKSKEVPIRVTIWVIMDEMKCETEKNNKSTLELMDSFDLVLRVNF